MAKLYDCAVKVEQYTNAQGETKNKYQNIGAVIEGDNGPYMILDRWINLAGIPNPDDRSNVIVSLFKPRQDDAQPVANKQERTHTNFDEIPF